MKTIQIHRRRGLEDDGQNTATINEGGRFFPNNLKPATHFIEVYGKSDGATHNTIRTTIKYLNKALKGTKDSASFHTIAIFKIRPK